MEHRWDEEKTGDPEDKKSWYFIRYFYQNCQTTPISYWSWNLIFFAEGHVWVIFRESENSTTGVVLDFGKLWKTKHWTPSLMRNILIHKGTPHLLKILWSDIARPALHCQSITCNNYTHLVSCNINQQSIVARNGEEEKRRRDYKNIVTYLRAKIGKVKDSFTNDKLYPSWLVFINLTVDEMHISPGPGKVHVTKDRQGAWVGASITSPSIVDNEDAGDQVSRHLYTHAEVEQFVVTRPLN